MRKCILMPDSFKGTMSSIEVCEIMREKIIVSFPNCEVIGIPVADGGEGTVDCFLTALGGKKVELEVCGPLFERIRAQYGIIDHGSTAVIEMAACAGLPLMANRLDVANTTTYGVGEMIADALAKGCENIIVGLGGSCTNDGGAGMAAAMGTCFFNEAGEEFVPVGCTLGKIAHIEYLPQSARVRRANIMGMCDVDNPLLGDTGAAAIFGPQKGADAEMIRVLDENLRHMAEVIQRESGMEIASIAGAGAAGGMGAGMIAYLGAKLKRGIDIVLDTVRFEELLQGVDCVLTGEGRIDQQSLRGKVVQGVASRAKRHNVPVIAVVGDIGDDIEQIYSEGVSSIFSINTLAIPFTQAKLRSCKDLAFTMDNLMRCIRVFSDCPQRVIQ